MNERHVIKGNDFAELTMPDFENEINFNAIVDDSRLISSCWE